MDAVSARSVCILDVIGPAQMRPDVKLMHDLLVLAAAGLAALLGAWVVTVLVGMLSGERPHDTGKVWADVLLRLFALLEVGAMG